MTLPRVVPSTQSRFPLKLGTSFGKPHPAPKPSQSKKTKGRKTKEAEETKN